MIRPKSVTEANKYLNAPLSHTNIVLYLSKREFRDGSVEFSQFVLNPFGGGINNTEELELRDDFKITKRNLSKILIVSNDEFKSKAWRRGVRK